MPCPYAELANKIEVHQKFDTPGVGYILTELDVQTIIEALRYTSDWKAAIEDADGAHQQVATEGK